MFHCWLFVKFSWIMVSSQSIKLYPNVLINQKQQETKGNNYTQPWMVMQYYNSNYLLVRQYTCKVGQVLAKRLKAREKIIEGITWKCNMATGDWAYLWHRVLVFPKLLILCLFLYLILYWYYIIILLLVLGTKKYKENQNER